MTRHKKTGRAGRAARSQAQSRNQNENLVSPFPLGGARAQGNSHWSLADEARNTLTHRIPGGLDSSANLRKRPVVFVSAGLIEPLEDLNLDDKEDDAQVPAVPHGKGKGKGKQHDDDVQHRNEDTMIADTPADQQLSKSAPGPTIPEEEPSFFVDITGEQKLCSGVRKPVAFPDRPSSGDETDSSEEVILFKGRSAARQDESPALVLDEMKMKVETIEETVEETVELEPTIEQTVELDAPATAETSANAPPILTPAEEQAAILADYIANMDKDDDEDDDDEEGEAYYRPSFGKRDLGGADDELVVDEPSDSDDSDVALDAHDGDNESESAEAPFAFNFQPETAADEMSDEQLARMLAKQEELGVLDDDLAVFSAEFTAIRANASTRKKDTSSTSTKKSKGKKAGGEAPSASAVADAFDELDLMDWERHNPSRKPKAKRGQPTFDMSDSELEATLQNSWQNDRLRKKERKAEREELRAQGLLRKGANPSDPRVKYQEGMSMDQIKEEVRAFLLGAEDSLTLPPMDANARKIVHELANKFKVKSKSTGKADTRRPCLYKTKNTMLYAEAYFERVFARTGRKYFPRLDVKGNRPSRPAAGPGRVNHAAFTYRDGEVVGASAPELGTNNRGRNMLEKMGWSTGMGLGSVENTGILQPVAHVVKRSKAGLG